jgi:uncharacterized membrane-anchored protein YhcB (DUF1043 family)
MRKSSFSAWVYLLMVFAAGTALGVVSDRLYTAKSVIAKSKPTAAEFRQRYVDELRTHLKLDAKQVTELSAILDDTDKRMQDLHEHYRPDMTAIHQDQVEKVHAILTEPQRAAYDKMRKERQRQREAEEKAKNKS